jgi:Fe-S oxidoreductase
MNPGKVVDPYLPTENLRLGADYKPLQPHTHFKFADDDGSFAKSTLRCLGIGTCRKQEGGTMCPSYMVTMEEEHSTRGRAHMLFEMLQGEVLPGGWQNEQVKQSLDLCLSCKACKSECPSNVDMATWKAEFLSHYYENKSRPLRAYAFGMVNRWLRMASIAPGTANFFSSAPGFSHLLRSVLGLAPQRQLPRLAPKTFWRMARQQRVALTEQRAASTETGGREVVLWIDTFNNHFHPEAAQAALEVLTNAGFKVFLPGAGLCCGRPLYDFGMIATAKRYLERIMNALEQPLADGVPVVVLEPSCASVFRDELRNLFPDDPRAERLARQSFLLCEFLQRHAPDYRPPQLSQKVLLHGHCHQKALMKMDHAEALLRGMGVDLQMPDAGCCGMAGPFGFEKEKFQISQAIGERVLLPAVRRAGTETLIVTDGFSCREQIFQATGRRAIHLAEAMRLGMRSRNT